MKRLTMNAAGNRCSSLMTIPPSDKFRNHETNDVKLRRKIKLYPKFKSYVKKEVYM